METRLYQKQLKKSVILTYLVEKFNNRKIDMYKSPLDRFYYRIFKKIEEMFPLYLESLAISENVILEKQEIYTSEDYLDMQERISEQVNDLKITLKHSNKLLSPEIVEKILFDAIVKE
jgi:hypothetical protein